MDCSSVHYVANVASCSEIQIPQLISLQPPVENSEDVQLAHRNLSASDGVPVRAADLLQ